MAAQNVLIVYDPENQRCVLTATVKELQQQILQLLGQFHRSQPLKLGLPKEELRRRLPEVLEVRLFNYLLQDLEKARQIVVEKDLVRAATHKVVLQDDQEQLAQKLEALYRQGGLTPPTLKEAAAAVRAEGNRLQDILKLLVSQGKLVKVKEDLYFHAQVMVELKEKLTAYLKEHGEISVPQFKDLTQTSRKFTIPLLEYFDANRITVRVGENRRLR